MFDNVQVRFDLGCKVLPGNLAAGMFDDSGFSLVTVAASGDKIIIHNESNQRPLSKYFNRRLEVSLGGNSFINYLNMTDIVESIMVVTLKDLEAGNALLMSYEDQLNAPITSEIFDKEEGESKKSESRDILVIGCTSTLLIYDVKINCDLYYKKVTTPISSLVELPSDEDRIDNSINVDGYHKTIACGTSNRIMTLRITRSNNTCNNSLTTTTTRDKIQSMVTGSLAGRTIVITGSEEGRIIGYDVSHNGKQPVYTTMMFVEETSGIACLCAIPTITMLTNSSIDMGTKQAAQGSSTTNNLNSHHHDHFDHLAYGTKNEIIGTFRLICSEDPVTKQFNVQVERLWRIKIKDVPLSMLLYDIDGDGLDELIIGCRVGKIEVRNVFTGEIKHKMRLERNAKLAGMCVADYCQDEFDLLLICSTDGTIFGYRPHDRLPKRKLINYNYNRMEISKRVLNNHHMVLQNNFNKMITDSNNEIRHIEEPDEESLPDYQGDSTCTSKCTEVQNNTLIKALVSKLKHKEELSSQMRSLQDTEFMSEFHKEVLRKADMDLIWDAGATHQKIFIDWAIDIQNCVLILTVSIRSKLSGFKLLLIREERMNLFSGGYMIAIPPESMKSSSIPLNELATIFRANDDVECELDLTIIVESDIYQNEQPPDQVINKKILVPAFSMYALFPMNQEWPEKPRPSVSINLPNISHQKVWQWMERKFLCLQILSKLRPDELNRYIASILNYENTIDLRLLDLRSKTISETMTQEKVPSSDELGLSRIRFCSRTCDLFIESESKKFLANVVRSLVIEWLHIDRYNSKAKIESMLTELSEKTLVARQYDETDNKILAEFSETSKNLESLMEQLYIAGSFCEYQTSKDIINELVKMQNDVINLSKVRNANHAKHQELKNDISELGDQIAILELQSAN